MFKKKAVDKTAGADGAAASPRPRRKLFLIFGVVVVLVLAAGGGLVATIGMPRMLEIIAGDSTQTDPDPEAAQDAEGAPPGADLVVMPFEAIIVNIAAPTASGQPVNRFLKLDLALVYDRVQDADGKVETRHIYIREAFQEYLRQLTERDFVGTLGLVTVKSELLRRARAITGSDAPHEIVVTELVVQ